MTAVVDDTSTKPAEDIPALLRRLHAGDDGAVGALLARVMPWLSSYLRPRLRGPLRAKVETQDAVQDALAEFLRFAPKFVVHSEQEFRAFMRQVADNVVRGHHRYFERQRRRLSKERPLSGLTQAVLDSGTPSQAASQDEGEARVRLALELLDPLERRIICMKVYDERSFRDIGVPAKKAWMSESALPSCSSVR